MNSEGAAPRLRIGFASVYAWRPHVEHLHYLAQLARRDGHAVRFLVCDGDLPHCYTRELRDKPHWRECAACRIGGLRSFESTGVSAFGRLQDGEASASPGAARAWALSSASTLGRFESPADFDSAAFHALADRLAPAVDIAYRAARRWIEREALDAVCVFNGRMEATRGIFEAARDAGVRVVSVERTWFGHGLQLLPDEHCLGLRSVWRLVSEWRDRPLTRRQATQAAALGAQRFLRANHTEWRAYNLHAVDRDWPVTGARRRVLFLPGSTNEIWGHPDWQSGWRDPLEAVEAVMQRLDLRGEDLVMRCHPNWGERIGKNDGRLPEAFYTDWARRRGVHVIPSRDTTSTLNLIAQCELLLLQAGSAAFEAGLLGKRIVSTAPSIYHHGGFTENVHAPADLDALAGFDTFGDAACARAVARQALRFGYTLSGRVAQYARFVRALSSSRYAYLEGADPARLTRSLVTGQLEADDDTWADEPSGEDAVLDAVARGEWAALAQEADTPMPGTAERVSRRWMFRPVDTLRGWMPVGDR